MPTYFFGVFIDLFELFCDLVGGFLGGLNTESCFWRGEKCLLAGAYFRIDSLLFL
ncbi:MAG: hypothetical protein ACTSSA_00025 [Candidatus Freyarchaeota archaeon]